MVVMGMAGREIVKCHIYIIYRNARFVEELLRSGINMHP